MFQEGTDGSEHNGGKKMEHRINLLHDTGTCLSHIHDTLSAMKQERTSTPSDKIQDNQHDWLQAATEHLRDHHIDCPLLQRTALGWCRSAGRLKLFDSVVASADIVLLSETGSPQQRALAAAYKSFAFIKMNPPRYGEAIHCLEYAHTIFYQHPPKQQHSQQVQQCVEESILLCCRELGREPPLPPMIKFPRTAHLFHPKDSSAVTADDKVMARDHAMLQMMCDGKTLVTMEEKVDGANLGISLSMDGERILVQNRSHYISTGEHAQFGQLTAFIEEHRAGLMQILTNDDDGDKEKDQMQNKAKQNGPIPRRILFGEWLVARHSIPYGQLPKYFVAFDLCDIASGKFVSRRKLHTMLQGTGIPVAPVLGRRMFGPHRNTQAMEKELMQILTTTKSSFRTDEGLIEGIVFRVDSKDWLLERSKLVRPDFVGGCQEGHWSKRAIDKQTVDFEFAEEYLQHCYSQAAQGLPISVENPRQRVLVTTYHRQDNTGEESSVLSIVNGNPKTVSSESAWQVLLPRNLCWLWKDEVAVSSTPTSAEQVTCFQTLNIGLVLTLTQEEPLPSEWFSSPASASAKKGDIPTNCCQNIFYAIPNGSPPTLQQMDCIGDDIVRAVAEGRAVLEHCGGGKGRAGSVAAALLLRFGRGGIRDRIQSENSESSGCRSLWCKPPFMTSEEAIQLIRQRRPGSLETVRQEEFVREYAQHLWRLAAAEEAVADRMQTESSSDEMTQEVTVHPTRSLTSAAKATRSLPSFIILFGIPGSGKSSIATCLSQHSSRRSTFVHANQDDMGGKACQDFVGRESARVANGQVGGIVLDCCSVREADRLNWLKIMHQPPAHKVALVFVDTPVDVCVARVRARVDHPTIPFGRGERIVRGFAKKLEQPTEKEQKLFGQIKVLRSTQDMLELLQHWGISTTATRFNK